MTRPSPRRPWWEYALGALGIAAHLAALVFYAASGLLAPGWAVVLLLLVWLALLAVAIRLLLRRPLLTLAVPVLAAAVWYAALLAGETFLGWTG